MARNLGTDYFDRLLDEPERVVVADGVLTIKGPSEYHIPMSRISSQDDLVAWFYHLTEKTWMTSDLMREFLTVAMQHAGLKLPNMP